MRATGIPMGPPPGRVPLRRRGGTTPADTEGVTRGLHTSGSPASRRAPAYDASGTSRSDGRSPGFGWVYVGVPRAQSQQNPNRTAPRAFDSRYPPVTPLPNRVWDPANNPRQAVVASAEGCPDEAPRLTRAWHLAWERVCAEPGIERPDLCRIVAESTDVTAESVSGLVRAAADGGIVTLRKTRAGGGRWRHRVYPGTGWVSLWRRPRRSN